MLSHFNTWNVRHSQHFLFLFVSKKRVIFLKNNKSYVNVSLNNNMSLWAKLQISSVDALFISPLLGTPLLQKKKSRTVCALTYLNQKKGWSYYFHENKKLMKVWTLKFLQQTRNHNTTIAQISKMLEFLHNST